MALIEGMTAEQGDAIVARLTDRKCAEAFARLHEGSRWQIYGGAEKEELTDKALVFLEKIEPAFRMALAEYDSAEETDAMRVIEEKIS